jgi:predicted lipoprotein with Yx(FWY)xxD motif
VRSIAVLVLLAAVAIAGCGDDDDTAPAGGGQQAAPGKGDGGRRDVAATEAKPAPRRGATITLQDSDFGPMLFDSKNQAIYVFERDGRDESVCYGGCAEAWPPVFTNGPPQARAGVREALLGTSKRRDGRAQVTYAGRPLYFYAHEDPGVVLCHNVNLNGGYWWAIGADGRRRPST